LVSKLLAPRYRLRNYVGRGACGQVWLVTDSKDGSHLIAKVLRFSTQLKELFAVGHVMSLRHPGIIDILGHEKSRDGAWLWYFMPPADDLTGGQFIFNGTYIPCTLRNFMQRPGGLAPQECAIIVLELCDALAYLHGKGFIHRDLKPENIVCVDGKWKLADIGLLAPTGSDSLVGTPGYMPPEGHGEPVGDIYSLGRVLKQMMTGRRLRRDDPSIAKTTPGEQRLAAVVQKACAENPAERYQTAEEMLRDINKL
jgi:serine/threonine-protein kinase